MRDDIARLKREKKAIILAHNYQRPEVQAVADVVGDSLELSVQAKNTDAEIIVFCGVDFMAETAKILNPARKVLLPVKDATCPLAHMLTPEDLLAARREHPEAAIVVYINSTAACKAVADVVCTSANAVRVVEALNKREVIFGPDANLAAYVQARVPNTRLIPVPPHGYCYVHTGFTLQDVDEARQKGTTIICHPECNIDVQQASDYIASTGGMVQKALLHRSWSVLTEKEMAHRLRTLFPDRTFIAKDGAICHEMKKTRLSDVYRSLLHEEYEVILPEDLMHRARGAIERMIAIGRG
ncbi:MAG: quinolinate synthase NadA [Methanomicrobiales archaeon]|nr:quinolinate synthase NadA [Methanomicrobiales archaeon]